MLAWVSHAALHGIRSRALEVGIFDGVRLTTARDEADLKVNRSGDHEQGQHRYQVLSLNTV